MATIFIHARDHRIPLQLGPLPINVWPYWCPHFHTESLKGMLDSGTIHPSTSPYSSPVFFVQKKDRSWRRCINYCTLNKITMKEKFPIPIIDELLDVLPCFKRILSNGVLMQKRPLLFSRRPWHLHSCLPYLILAAHLSLIVMHLGQKLGLRWCKRIDQLQARRY